jgi:hypothetical protein
MAGIDTHHQGVVVQMETKTLNMSIPERTAMQDNSAKILAEQAKAPTKVNINIVIDRSGSMSVICNDTIGGFNTFLKKQKETPGEATISYAQFDDVYEMVYQNLPIAQAPELSTQTYVPRGSTALLDAVGRTITAIEAAKTQGRIIVVIITDGHENASKEYTTAQIKTLIKSYEERGWEFVYLGANQDAFSVGTSMGFAGIKTMNIAANSIGTQSMYDSLATNTTNYRSGASDTMSFDADDRKKQEDAGAQKGP